MADQKKRLANGITLNAEIDTKTNRIMIVKRVKYAGDVYKALLDLGWDIETVAAFLNDIPDADAVEVMRCKDCNWYRLEDETCGFWPDEGYRDQEHYCGEGVKREG